MAVREGRALTWLDVFTSTPLSGNPLAVVHDADGLDDATMLAFARETRMSETTFVQAPTQPGATYRNRIFSMAGEMPFAGHPSLGTAVAVARARGEARAAYVQQTPVGLQPIDVLTDGDRATASMLQEPAEFGAELAHADVLGAAGLTAGDAHPTLPPQVVSTGIPHVLAPVADTDALGRASPPSYAALRDLLDAHDAAVLYLAAVAPDGRSARARAFFVAPGVTTEDPATGSAAGPLMAYLHARRGVEALAVDQAVEMGRPSRLDCAVEGARMRVTGACVVVADGHVRL